MGVLSFVKKVGKQRLANACKCALEYDISNYRIIQKILENGLDSIEEEHNSNVQILLEHQNIRGKHYYN